jgi:hypothetical protein
VYRPEDGAAGVEEGLLLQGQARERATASRWEVPDPGILGLEDGRRS